jgi:hypothetical protein
MGGVSWFDTSRLNIATACAALACVAAIMVGLL